MSLVACNKTNPLLEQPNTPYGVPAFNQIKLEHYLPAFEAAIAEQKAEKAVLSRREEAEKEADMILKETRKNAEASAAELAYKAQAKGGAAADRIKEVLTS